MSGPSIEVFPDAAALAEKVADRLLAYLAALQDTGITPHLSLTGGTIADAIHHEVARRHSRSEVAQVDWQRVHFWWGDERFVPSESTERNARQARQAMLAPLLVPPRHIHEIASSDGGRLLDSGVAEYTGELTHHWPGLFDLVMLGVGPDGHVASLFPGSEQLENTEDLVAAVTDSPKPPSERITMTLPTLNRANAVWFLASGAEKANAVGRALTESHPGSGPGSGPGSHQGTSTVVADASLPAARVRGRVSTTWFLDATAASDPPSRPHEGN